MVGITSSATAGRPLGLPFYSVRRIAKLCAVNQGAEVQEPPNGETLWNLQSGNPFFDRKRVLPDCLFRAANAETNSVTLRLLLQWLLSDLSAQNRPAYPL